MASTNGLDVARLRQLARVGAEVTLNRLRAEIAVIETNLPGAREPDSPPSSGAACHEAGIDQNAEDVGGSKKGSVGQDEALLGRTPQGFGEGGEVIDYPITHDRFP